MPFQANPSKPTRGSWNPPPQSVESTQGPQELPPTAQGRDGLRKEYRGRRRPCLPRPPIPRSECFLTSTTLRSRCNTTDLRICSMYHHGLGYSSSQPSRVEPPSDNKACLSTTIRTSRLALPVQALECLATINGLLGAAVIMTR